MRSFLALIIMTLPAMGQITPDGIFNVTVPGFVSTFAVPTVPELFRVPNDYGFCRVKFVRGKSSACFVYAPDIPYLLARKNNVGAMVSISNLQIPVPEGFDLNSAESARMALLIAIYVYPSASLPAPEDQR